MTQAHQFVALVPAGGNGTRVGGTIPKQYLALGNEPLIATTLRQLLAVDWITQVHVVVAPTDTEWQRNPSLRSLTARYPRRLFWHANGGATRQHTVAHGLDKMAGVGDETWVMVHDAARPGISAGALDSLRQVIQSGAGGALLATRVADTVKRERHGTVDSKPLIEATVDRADLWLAQTPQVFRFGPLRRAIADALESGRQFTDEASVMETTDTVIRLVEGDARNFKITTANDLALIRLLLESDRSSGSLFSEQASE